MSSPLIRCCMCGEGPFTANLYMHHRCVVDAFSRNPDGDNALELLEEFIDHRNRGSIFTRDGRATKLYCDAVELIQPLRVNQDWEVKQIPRMEHNPFNNLFNKEKP